MSSLPVCQRAVCSAQQPGRGSARQTPSRPQGRPAGELRRQRPEQQAPALSAHNIARLTEPGGFGRLSAAFLAAAVVTLSPADALADGFVDYAETPSRMQLKLKPRVQEVIQEAKADHNKENLSNEDFTGANFAEAELKEAKLEGCDLRGAVFSRSVMYQASLAGSDATNAMFDYVVLRGANLRGVIAEGANFVRSDLGEADVTDADFTDALIDRYQVEQLCEVASGTNPTTGVETRASLGCDRVKKYTGFNAGANKVAVVDAAKAKCLSGGCRG